MTTIGGTANSPARSAEQGKEIMNQKQRNEALAYLRAFSNILEVHNDMLLVTAIWKNTISGILTAGIEDGPEVEMRSRLCDRMFWSMMEPTSVSAEVKYGLYSDKKWMRVYLDRTHPYDPSENKERHSHLDMTRRPMFIPLLHMSILHDNSPTLNCLYCGYRKPFNLL